MNSLSESSSKWQPLKWYVISGTLLVLLVLLYIQFDKQRQSAGERNTSLEEQVRTLRETIMQKDALLTERENQMNSYKEYDALIQAARIREALYKQLPLTAGDRVLVLPDSMQGVINAVTITGNAFEYAIRYNVRKKDGHVEDLPFTNLIKVGGN